MKTNITELVFILDRSGSMAGLETDTIGGFNSMLKRQKEEAGEAIVTTVLFDDKYELLHDRIDINAIDPITEKDYFVCGSTALLDAIGKTIQKTVNVQKHMKEDMRPGKVMFVITTDGMENASREFSLAKIKNMIEHQKEKYGWEFIFLGANINAVETASQIGISADRAANYHADSVGTTLNFEAVSGAVSQFRASRPVSASWKSKIDADFNQRKTTR